MDTILDGPIRLPPVWVQKTKNSAWRRATPEEAAAIGTQMLHDAHPDPTVTPPRHAPSGFYSVQFVPDAPADQPELRDHLTRRTQQRLRPRKLDAFLDF